MITDGNNSKTYTEGKGSNDFSINSPHLIFSDRDTVMQNYYPNSGTAPGGVRKIPATFYQNKFNRPQSNDKKFAGDNFVNMSIGSIISATPTGKKEYDTILNESLPTPAGQRSVMLQNANH